MPFPRVIPHSDGAGVIDAVGAGVSKVRVGQQVWCYGAQSYRPFGTAAEFVVVPQDLAVELPAPLDSSASVLDVAEQAACLGIAGVTAHRSVFADGPVVGLTVLVHGATGGVGSIATQLATRGGATVLAVVRNSTQQARALELGATNAFLTDGVDLADKIRSAAPGGVHRISEVDLAAHIDLDAAIIATGGVICSIFSSEDRPEIPYWTLGFADTTVRFLGSDDFSPAVKSEAAHTLTSALLKGRLHSRIAARIPLTDIVQAHELVEQGTDGRIIVTVSQEQ